MNDNSETMDPLKPAMPRQRALGQRLEQRRVAQGVALSDAASSIGTSIDALAAIESGHRAINPQELCLLCQLLKVDIGWPFDEPLKQIAGQESRELALDQPATGVTSVTSVEKRWKDRSEP